MQIFFHRDERILGGGAYGLKWSLFIESDFGEFYFLLNFTSFLNRSLNN